MLVVMVMLKLGGGLRDFQQLPTLISIVVVLRVPENFLNTDFLKESRCLVP